MKIIQIVLFLFIACLVQTSVVNAQEISVSTSPPLYKIISKPGSFIDVPYTIVNHGDPTLVTISIYRLGVSNDRGGFSLVPYNEPLPTEPQVAIIEGSQEPILLMSNEALDGKAAISIPEKAKEQDYYFAIVAESKASKGFETSTTIHLQGGVGTTLLISVTKSGNTQKKLSMEPISIRPLFSLNMFNKTLNFLNSYTPISVKLNLKNNGIHLVELNGASIMTASMNLLPIKPYDVEIPHTIVYGSSERSIDMKQIPGQLVGFYTLRTSLNVQDSDTLSTATSFFVFPFIFFAWVIGGFIIAAVIYMIVNKKNRS